jgi:hypothetical protein
MPILVEDSAQTSVSPYLQVDVGRFDDRRRQRTQQPGLADASVGTVFVAEGLKLLEGLQEMPPAPDKASGRAVHCGSSAPTAP